MRSPDIEPNCYKVVGVRRGKKVSCFARSPYSLVYERNVEVKPCIGKMFVFKHLDHARLFARARGRKTEIWEAYGTNLEKLRTRHIPFFDDVGLYRRFWKAFQNSESWRMLTAEMPVPANTFLADSLVLVRKV